MHGFITQWKQLQQFYYILYTDSMQQKLLLKVLFLFRIVKSNPYCALVKLVYYANNWHVKEKTNILDSRPKLIVSVKWNAYIRMYLHVFVQYSIWIENCHTKLIFLPFLASNMMRTKIRDLSVKFQVSSISKRANYVSVYKRLI